MSAERQSLTPFFSLFFHFRRFVRVSIWMSNFFLFFSSVLRLVGLANRIPAVGAMMQRARFAIAMRECEREE